MVIILLLNVVVVLSVGGGDLLDRPCNNINLILILNRILNGIHSSNIVLSKTRIQCYMPKAY